MTAAKTATPNVAILGSVALPVRFSYLHAHTPKKKKDDNGSVQINEDTGKPVMVYSVQIRVPKADTAGKAAADKAIAAAGADFFGDKYAALAKTPQFKTPFRDGDVEADAKEDPTLKGHWFFNASSINKPGVVGPRRNPDTGKFDQLGEDEIKSGDYGKVSIGFFGFKGKASGVAAGLNNLQLLKIGESLGGRSSAENDFDDEDAELDGVDNALL